MLSYDHALAILLLTTPLDPAELGPLLDDVMPAFLQVAVAAEVLDVREEQFFEGLSRDPAGDVRVLRQRYQNLLNAPSLAECERFLERKLIEEYLVFNRDYRKHLAQALDWGYSEHVQMAIHDVDQCHFAWSLLRDAQCRYYYTNVRRQSLRQLRDVVGAEAFYSSQMPPPVPLAHFPRMP